MDGIVGRGIRKNDSIDRYPRIFAHPHTRYPVLIYAAVALGCVDMRVSESWSDKWVRLCRFASSPTFTSLSHVRVSLTITFLTIAFLVFAFLVFAFLVFASLVFASLVFASVSHSHPARIRILIHVFIFSFILIRISFALKCEDIVSLFSSGGVLGVLI